MKNREFFRKNRKIFVSILALFVIFCSANGYARNNPVFTLVEATISSIHQAISDGRTTCAKITRGYLNRIKKYDQKKKLNAIVTTNPQALLIAKQLDEKYQSTQEMGPLHCVPVIVKDNIETQSMPTSAGSIVFKGFMSGRDAPIVARLKKAGAIMLAKSNMAEWAFSPYHTISSTAGETLNAYDLGRVPAGSSGGTASAVAANLGLVGLGSDTGNSVRGPASHLALVGLRPTQGLFDHTGVVPLLANRDMVGPMTRTVKDAARLLTVLVGEDSGSNIDYAKGLKPNALAGARFGVLRSLFDVETADPEVADLMTQAMADLKRAGVTLVDPFTIKDLKKLTEATGFCSRFRYDINQYFDSFNGKAPVKRIKEVVDSQRFYEGSKGAFKWAMSTPVDIKPEQQETACVDVEGDPRRKALRDAVVKAMNEHNIDALIYPSWNNPPREIGDLESPHGNNSPIIAPHAGLPAITVPMGFTSEKLPTGLQIMGRAYSEKLLFEYAFAYENATRHRVPPSLFP